MLIKELTFKYRQIEVAAPNLTHVEHPSDCIPVLQDLLGDAVQETSGILAFDPQMHLLGYSQLSIGTMNMTLAEPRDIFRTLCTMNAGYFVLAHNHPVGANLPSVPDIRMFWRLRELGSMMNIPMLESFVVNGFDAIGIGGFVEQHNLGPKCSDSEITATLLKLMADLNSDYANAETAKQGPMSFKDALSIVYSSGTIVEAQD